MEFQPFWKLLEELGIELPEPSRLEELRESPPNTRKPARRTRRSPKAAAEDEVIDLLGALQMIAALEEIASLSADQSHPLQSHPSRSALPAPDCWVPFGETVQVGGYEIPGMVYVGEQLSSLKHQGIEPCLIRPALGVGRRTPDYTKPPAAYNPSYTQMREADRAAYLSWLAGGRCDSKAHSSYVWLFFYGLERRLLHDLLPQAQAPDRQAEIRQIAVEIKRLKQLYGNPVANWSFDHKTTALLEVCDLLVSDGQTSQSIDLEKAPLLSLQIGLGQFVKQKQPLPADWALAWYTRLANNPLPTAASRCPAEFKTLFELRYAQTYGAGMLVKPGKTRLTVGYFPSNPSFGRMVDVPVGDLPDLSRFTAKLNQIAELLQDCRLELDPLSRLLGRNASAKGTAAAIALLPADLMAEHGGEVLKRLTKWLKHSFATAAFPLISGPELLKHWAGSHPDKLTATEAQNFSKLLARLGYGLEPDARFGGPLPNTKSQFALFPWPADHPEALSVAYFDATLQVQMALAVASGEQCSSALEQQYLEQQIAQMLELNPAERVRLRAHMQVLLHQTPALRNLKLRIERLHPQKRPATVQLLLRVAAADGPISPSEIKLLEKAYELLELDPQALYGHIHDLSTLPNDWASEPVTVLKAAPSQGHKIPARPQAGLPQAGLNMGLVQSKLAESQEISSLLADIFTEAESPVGQPAKPTAAAPAKKSTKTATSQSRKSAPVAPVAGLDEPHSALLRRLAGQTNWQRAALAEIASQLDLMLDGALEVINELAFERTDEPVTEGEDVIEVNQTVLQELLG